MTASLSVDVDGQVLTVDLALVNALDALVYRETVGEELDRRLAALIDQAAGEDFDSGSWSLADAGILKWLAVRQLVDGGASLASVMQTVTMFPTVEGEG